MEKYIRNNSKLEKIFIRNNSNGITLIALVITIILLLILAGISISVLTGSGLFEKAKIAKNRTQEAQELENQALQEYENQINQLGNVDGKWVETDSGITNGKITLQIGDYVNYISPNSSYTSPCGSVSERKFEIIPSEIERGSGYSKPQTFNTQNYTGGWRLLGIDEESGGLKLISADVVKTVENNSYFLAGYTGYCWADIELENICKIFEGGLGCKEAKCIKFSDINKITGYNPLNTGNGEVCDKGEFNEYGNEVTYSWSKTIEDANIVDSRASNGLICTSTRYAVNSVGFELISNDGNKHFEFEKGKEICTMTSSAYYYQPSTLTNEKEGEIKGLNPQDKKYLTLFCNEQDEQMSFWINDRFINTNSNVAAYNVAAYYDGMCASRYLYTSEGLKQRGDLNVRPIIILENEVEIKRWRWKD